VVVVAMILALVIQMRMEMEMESLPQAWLEALSFWQGLQPC
jgi:hypothetical protein